MLPALLLFVTLDPAPDLLDSLQGTWDGTNGTVLVIGGNTIEVTAADGVSGFTAELRVGPRRLRMIDSSGVGEWRAWRREGGRLWVGDGEYRRRLLGTTGAGCENDGC